LPPFHYGLVLAANGGVKVIFSLDAKRALIWSLIRLL
jgi:hypothetical protein